MFKLTAGWYDLVYAGVGKDYAAEAEQILRMVRARVPDAATLLDVACGTGAHLAHLREHLEVTGADVDPSMVALARERLPAGEVVVADMEQIDLGRRFDAVTCLFSSIGYVTSRDGLQRAIAAMARHLRPGGVLVVEGWVTPEQWRDGHVGAVSAAEDGRAVARVDVSHRDGEVSVLEMHYLLARAGHVEHAVEEHRLRLHTRQEYLQAFEAAGLVDVSVDETALLGRGVYVGTAP